LNLPPKYKNETKRTCTGSPEHCKRGIRTSHFLKTRQAILNEQKWAREKGGGRDLIMIQAGLIVERRRDDGGFQKKVPKNFGKGSTLEVAMTSQILGFPGSPGGNRKTLQEAAGSWRSVRLKKAFMDHLLEERRKRRERAEVQAQDRPRRKCSAA